MADKVALVRLRAQNDNYDRAMERSKQKTEELAATAPKVEQLGAKFETVGDKLTRRLTLPLVGLSAAGFKVASDFETTFARMVGLADVPADKIDQLRDSVLRLATETGKGPQELAEALYEAASAGLTAEQALAAVEVAARASAAGMGPTADIVGLVASATAAYGASAITAAEATDILVATIRAGRADPQELAGTLGRVLPIAAQLGIEFDEVGGAVAYLSNVFGDTNRTVTALQGFLVKLVSPSQQGRDALEDMGTSAADLQRAIDERGLQGALEHLREYGFAENQQALRSLFDDIEGFQAALALLNDRSGTLDDTLSEVANSTGALQDAFSTWLGTDSAKTAQAFQQITVALIEFGGKVAPLVAELAQLAGTVAGIVGIFPDWLVQLGLLTAIMGGPLLKAGGFVLSNFEQIKKVAQTLATAVSKAFDAMALGAYAAAGAMTTVAAATAALTVGIGALAFAWQASAQRAAQHKRDLADIEKAYWGASGALQFLTEETGKYLLEQSRFHDRNQIDDLNRLDISVIQLSEHLAQGAEGLEWFVRKAEEGGEITRVFRSGTNDLVDAMGNYVGTAGEAVAINGQLYVGNTDLIKSFQREQDLIEEVAQTKLQAALASGKLSTATENEIRAALESNTSKYAATEISLQYADALAAAGFEVDGVAAAQARLEQETDTATAALNDQLRVLDQLWSSMFGGASVSLSIDKAFAAFNATMSDTERSGGRAGRAIDAVAEKQKKLEQATEAAERANESWQRSIDDVERAQRELIDAQEELDRLLQGPTARDQAEALNRQRREELALEEARKKLAEAQEALAEAEASGDPEELAAARRNLERAELDLETQTWRLEDATKAYNEVANWSAETDKKVADARQRVTDAEKRLSQATTESERRLRELGKAQNEAADIAAKSPAEFAKAEGGVSRLRDRALDARSAFDQLSESIKGSVAQLLQLAVTDAAGSAAELQRLKAVVEKNPFLNDQQRRSLLEYISAAWHVTQGVPSWATPGFMPFDTGGVVPGPKGKPVPVLAHAGETILPTHKRPLESITAAPVLAGVGAASTDARRGDFIIQQATFGSDMRESVQHLDWWWRTQGAGV